MTNPRHESPSRKSTAESSAPTARQVGRQVVAALVISTALGGALLAPKAVSHVKEQHRIDQEYSDFKDPNIADKIDELGIEEKDLLRTEVAYGERNPTEVAAHLGAKDLGALSEVISAQVGGAGNMEQGEPLIIPKDLLQPPEPKQ